MVFDAGEYGSLQLRPTPATARVFTDLAVEVDGTNPETLNAEYYHYYREIRNVKLVGAEGSKFKGLLAVRTVFTNGTENSDNPVRIGLGETAEITDLFRNKTASASVRWFDYVDVDTLAIENMNFEGQNGRVFFGMMYGNTGYTTMVEKLAPITVKNVTVENCSFKTDTAFTSYAAVYFRNDTATNTGANYIANIKVRNCTIDGHYQGVWISNAANFEASNNTIKNTVHNSLAIQGGSVKDHYMTGAIVVKNNKISNVENRGIRLGCCKDAVITVENNEFEKCVSSSSKEVLRSETLDGCAFDFKNNKYEGQALPDVENSTKTAQQIAVSWLLA